MFPDFQIIGTKSGEVGRCKTEYSDDERKEMLFGYVILDSA
jgi:hypothetical protein